MGFQYYDNLINELLANGIEPFVTIFHFELPQPLQDLGGWTNPLIIDYYVAYADILFGRYGDRVKYWVTINEPNVLCELGYGKGQCAPFIKSQGVGMYICGHNTLLANARAYDLYQKKHKRPGGKVGIVIVCQYAFPEDKNNVTHIAAAERAMQFGVCIQFCYR